VRAVTAWALLGSYDWDSLLTRRRGNYEPGAFDVRRRDETGIQRRPARELLHHSEPSARMPRMASEGTPSFLVENAEDLLEP
jgi:hypothetical protein